MSFAAATKVGAERSRAEIEKLVRKHGADRFVSGWSGAHASVLFEIRGRRVRFELLMPSETEFKKSPGGYVRNAASQKQACEQEQRRRWRALLLVIKAKLEAVESKISTFEEEFLAFIVLPNNETVGKWIAPQIEQAYGSGKMPPLLSAGGGV